MRGLPLRSIAACVSDTAYVDLIVGHPWHLCCGKSFNQTH
jgi:hypothetical protein